MEVVIITICVCLLIVSILLYRYISVKRELRRFSAELEKLKDSSYRQPVKVGWSDKDVVQLAVKVNEHTDIQRALGLGYEKSKKQLGTVISGISHDFRTPLTAALGYMQMIEKSGELSEKNAEYLDIAIQKSRYLKELSDEFFELTIAENGNEDIHTEPVDISSMLTSAVLEQHDWITAQGIATHFDIIDGIVVQADPVFVKRILHDLMSNARKYTHDSFGVSLVKDGERVRLRVYDSVSDTASVDIERVFEPFYRMSSRTSEGTGLGLYVVKTLCDKLGWTANAALEGSVFSIEICI
ncbi:MAG: HAMP domain-containing histidine kinase [Oscillospiraceae bacterium]|nr:HAMP domain-containing histidine kinase [Oscillospiraceae bacterium]